MSTFRLAYENPIKCKNVEEVRAKMAEWLHYATEYELNTGYKFNDQGRLEALKRFLPEGMAQQIEKMVLWEYKTYDECLKWVKRFTTEKHTKNPSTDKASMSYNEHKLAQVTLNGSLSWLEIQHHF